MPIRSNANFQTNRARRSGLGWHGAAGLLANAVGSLQFFALLVLGTIVVLSASRARASDITVDEQTKVALGLDADPKHGKLVFHEHCSRCHGEDAHGDEGRAIPSLAGQRFSYLVRQLADISGEERESLIMHRVLSAPELSQPQTWVDVASYLNGAPMLQPAPVVHSTSRGLGEGIFKKSCASCHHEDARGDDDGFVPSLRNQHYSYLVAQVRRISKYSRHNVDENLVQFFRSLEPEEVSAVADYVTRLQVPVKDRKAMRSNGVVVD